MTITVHIAEFEKNDDDDDIFWGKKQMLMIDCS
jgi:hypothetical protein